MKNPRKPTRVRSRINKYTAAPIIALSSFIFMTIVPFLPGSPVFPMLMAIALGILTFLKSPSWSSAILYVIVFLSLLWQLIGFGIFQIQQSTMGVFMTVAMLAFLIFNLLSVKLEPTSMALAILAVALMLTPYYPLSIALIVAASAISGLSSIGSISSTFITTLLPMLILENSIYYSTLPQVAGVPPIIFSELTFTAENMRPPLPGLNVFLTGLPKDFMSKPLSNMLGKYLALGGYLRDQTLASEIIVPLIIFSVIFSLSAALAGLVNTMLSRLFIFERTSRLLKVAAPFAASVVTPLAFVALITSLSGVGGYKTSLFFGSLESVILVSGSMLLGGVFTAREFLIQRLERSEKSRDILNDLIRRVRLDVKNNGELFNKIAVGAPTVSLGVEAKTTAEYASYVDDVERGIATANYASLTQWIEDVEKRILPYLDSLPEILRLKVVNELNLLITLMTINNSMLNEADVKQKFPELEAMGGRLGLEDALGKYGEITSAIRESSASLFDSYMSTSSAFTVLMDQQIITPPVNPAYLFDTHEYATGMKLIAEEYWMNFHIKNSQEIESKSEALTGDLVRLEEFLDPVLRSKVDGIIESMADAKPANSPLILQKVKDLVEVLASLVELTRNEIEQLEKLIKTLTPGATKIIYFEVIDQSNKLDELTDELKRIRPSIPIVTAFIQNAMSVLRSYRDGKRNDELNLIVLSQYPAAKNLIESLAQERETISIADLPFRHNAAVTYSKLFTLTSPSARYDDEKEVLLVGHA
jgi:hypothetical protein